jgi:WD40 repeat protein
MVVIGSEDGTIKMYNLTSGEKEGELKGHEDAVNQVIVDSSKDGYVISASSDCTFRVWQ